MAQCWSKCTARCVIRIPGFFRLRGVSWKTTSVENDWTTQCRFLFKEISWIPFHDYVNGNGTLVSDERGNYVSRFYINGSYVIGKALTRYGFYAAYKGRTYETTSGHQVWYWNAIHPNIYEHDCVVLDCRLMPTYSYPIGLSVKLKQFHISVLQIYVPSYK